MFSRKSNGPHDSDKSAEKLDPQDSFEEATEPTITDVVTGEDVTVDPSSEIFDTTDLVGSASNEDFDVIGFEETVALPTGRASFQSLEQDPKPAEEASQTTDTGPMDVLANRNLNATSTFGAVEESEVKRLNQDTQVMRKSLLGVHEEELVAPPVEHFAAPEPMRTRSAAHHPIRPAESSLDSMMLSGATVLPSVSSKAPTRWVSMILTLIAVPIAWYMLSDSAARLAFADGNPMTTGNINLAALAEFAGGLSFLALIAVLAMQSSLGLFVSGALTFVVGMPFLVAPTWTDTFLNTYLGRLQDFNDFGANVFAHLYLTGFTGVLAIAGLGMMLVGMTVFSVRRAGRREEAMRAMVAATNPDGLRARWARKATMRDRQGK